ncbi:MULTISPECIES: methyl-accepting chemotaxis protein [Aeromonas]|jgi:methyl-accepting chemotaxis protein|uniref:Methyl-accepting chemotaxis protein n=2 Tax=Aeromonas caviae TaxID=648 RepID=A0AAV4YNK5_AERCA|nr:MULTISPECIES: methyl-accepting chemotaxis protein [Aeromonas]MBP6790342.1 methyl-accepting chemotaxis protein [Aeromonas sp.]MBP8268730.1 methyl-accepting chemotaxis protein [Aeromonas sp.]MBP8279244.1 methyl-accepting chemotaxis protein [Aeromonas sp.]MBP9659902.1 methyl-accepting chemotaxis protein [Aeromonas sp.]MEA9419634.1 methyl-accepting chemotaxis protein [Aeromonas caviae]
MGLSIVQRIIAGFVLMLLLLVLLGFISILKIRGINEGLSQVSDRATPLVIAVAGLKGALQDSNRWVLTYRTSEEAAQLPQLASQFKAQQERFLAQSKEMARFDGVAEASERFRQVDGATREFYGLADQVLTQHGQWVAALDRRHELELAFIRLEDTYQWAADLLLQQTASKRSMRNKAELITSGIARDLKNIRRADAKTDLNELEKVLGKDIEMARKRLERVQVPDDVRQRFIVNLDRMQELALGPKGLLATMRNGQQLAASLQSLNQQLDTSLVNSLALLDEMAKSAGSIASASRVGADDAVSSASAWILIVSAISAAAALLIGYTTARSIQRPLQLIDRELDRMATGDMTRRIDYQSRCEFGSLTRSINTLADKTGELLAQINAGSRHLVDEASRAAEISERAMSRVQDQKSQTDQVAAAITELEVSATEVARSTDGTKREVDLADEEARAGRKQVATTRQITEQLAGAMEEAVGITHKLGEFSDNIGSILDVIRSIAEQTNLLALNAAIEAARAGDAGRGFAVVADEVRALANRTQTSTEEIQAMIESLQSSSKHVVAVMARSQEQTQDCVAQTRVMDEALQSIAERMSAIKAMADQVAHAAQEQISVSQGVARHVAGIADVAYETEREARESASSSEVLADLVAKQQQLIAHFKV